MRNSNRIFPVILSLVVTAIAITGFELISPKSIAHAQTLPTGCAAGGSSTTPSTGFDPTKLDMNTASVNSDGYIQLDTGTSQLDVNNITIPFEQVVSTVFLLEGAGYKSDLGWFVKGQAEELVNNGNPITGTLPFSDLVNAGVELNYLFRTIEDDQETGGCCGGGNGVLDTFYNETNSYLGNSTGLTEDQLRAWGFRPNKSSIRNFVNKNEVDPRDMRKRMGTLGPETEIVYFLHANGDIAGKTFYSKDGWSRDTWSPSDSRKANTTLVFDLSIPAPEQGGPPTKYTTGKATQGFVPTAARDRLGNPDGKAAYPPNGYFNVKLSGALNKVVKRYQKYNHYLVASPPNDPFKWVIGVEDLLGGGDADFNDLVFMIERKTGGVAQLKSTEALSPADSNAYITSVTIEVTDSMPCKGKTEIKYLLSIDNGQNWVEISEWDVIKTPDKSGSDVTDWVFGTPKTTYRSTTVNFSELGYTGRELIWKAEMVSKNDQCVPEIISIDLSYNAAVNQSFSRSAPVVLGNVIYSGSFETPAANWNDKVLRGHFTSQQLYDPKAPNAGFNILDNWDAGQKLTSDGPSRDIRTPNMTPTQVVGEILAQGDGSQTDFTGTLALTKTQANNEQIIHSTIEITDGLEIFTDKRTTELVGSMTGTGTINRYTGEYTLSFNTPPGNGVDITADYGKFTYKSTLDDFNSSAVDRRDLALSRKQIVGPKGRYFVYDFNGDDKFSEADASWLKKWVSGYEDGTNSSAKKEWLLSAIDHSAPAIVGAPGSPSWYFGTGVSDEQRDSFDVYRCSQRDRKTYAFIGSRMGTLHAFYAGEYKPAYVDESLFNAATTCTSSNLQDYKNAVNPEDCRDSQGNPTYPGRGVACSSTSPGTHTINRGYYEWSGSAPNYGDGSENWAVIPADQIAKLKNNKMKNDDMAFVDASPSAAYVRFNDDSWHTVIVSAEGNGGDHIFALDITLEDNPKLLWEFADPDLFRSRSSPSVVVIGQIRGPDPKWVAFFVSGVSASPTIYPSIYMLDMENGAVLKRIFLDSTSAGIGGTPSGQPAVVDSDGDGFADKMYIGTDKGYMYKITLGSTPSDTNVCTLFNAGQPIYASPAVVVKNEINSSGEVDYRTLVFFGTGDSPFHVDAVSDQYYFYAIADTDDPGQCRTVTNPLWRYALPPGHRIFASAFASAEKVYFGTTSADTDDPCAPPTPAAANAGAAQGKLFVIDAEAGGTPILEEDAGNITTTPVVVDDHLYVKTGTGKLKAYGGGKFDNKLTGGSGPSRGPTVRSWREIN